MPLQRLWLKLPAHGRVGRQTKWSLAVAAFEVVRGVAQITIVFRILGRENYGVLVPIYYVTGLLHTGLWVLSDQAITTYGARSLEGGRPREASLIVWSNIKISFALGLAAYFILVILAYVSPNMVGVDDEHQGLLLVFGLTAVFTANRKDSLAVLRLTDRYHYSFVVAIVTGVAHLGALWTIWKTGGSLWLVVLISTGAAAISGSGMLAAAALSARRTGLPRPPRGSSIRDMPADVTKFLQASFWQTKAGALGWHLDPILAAKVGTDAQAAIYGIVRRVTDTLDLLGRAVGSVIQTEYSRAWFAPDGDGIRPVWLRATVALAALALAICGGIFLFRDVVERLLGEDFVGGATTLVYVLPGVFVYFAATAVDVLPAAVGRVWPSFTWISTALVVQVAAILLLVPMLGADGAALSRTLFYMSLTVVAVPFVIPLLRRNRYGDATSAS